MDNELRITEQHLDRSEEALAILQAGGGLRAIIGDEYYFQKFVSPTPAGAKKLAEILQRDDPTVKVLTGVTVDRRASRAVRNWVVYPHLTGVWSTESIKEPK